jgi:hypothetical protein
MRFKLTGTLAVAALAAALAAAAPVSAAPRGGHGGMHAGGHGGGGMARMGGGGMRMGGGGGMRTGAVGFRGPNSMLTTNSSRSLAANSGFRRGNPGWRGGTWDHRRHYGGFGAGFATGALLGSAPYWGSWGPYAYDDYAYDGYATYDDGDVGYVAAPEVDAGYADAPDGDAQQYCMQRFKSYDPSSGTYLGYDGARHPCP